MILRDYQQAAVDSLFAYFNANAGNPIIGLPTGTGKSLVLAGFIQQALAAFPGTRIMKLTHVKELVEQNADKLLKVWPTAPLGIFSAGLKRKEVGYPIIFGGVASVAKADLSRFGRVDLLLIDECHLLSPKEGTMYQKVIAQLKEVNPFLKVIGFTATSYRLGQGQLTDEGGLFTALCFDMTKMHQFNWFIDQGYLVPLIPKRTSLELDVSSVKTSGGEYKQNELQEAVDKDSLTQAAVQEMIQHGHGRAHWLVFASGVEHAIHVSEVLSYCGISAGFVHSKMSTAERDAAIARFKAGEVRAIVNNGILTTGFDFPGIDLVGMLRPTKSPGLWVQMLGRGTRPVYSPGFDLSTLEGRLRAIGASQKQNTLVLDFAGNTRRLGPINDPVLPRRKGKGGDGSAPVKVCEVCGTYNHASVRICVGCGEEFPKHLKIKHQAGTDELIAKGEPPRIETFKVDTVTYQPHNKPGSLPSLQVNYFCGLRMFREWICLEHEGYPGKRARDWWRRRSLPHSQVPEFITEALEKLPELAIPTQIQVQIKPRYDEIVGYIFGEEQTNG